MFAQSRTVRTFECVMSPSKETPAVTATARGECVIEIVAERDAAGTITAARVDFHVNAWFAQAEMFTGMHIHRGAEGVAGPVVINTGLRGPLPGVAGANNFFFSAVAGENDLATVNAILANPSGFYCNLHSQSNPGGIIRGQLNDTAAWTAGAARTDVAAVKADVAGVKSDVAAATTVVNRLESFLRQVAFRFGIALN
jgi:hypothetical protein